MHLFVCASLFYFQTDFHCIDQVALELPILLPWSLECWD